MLKNYFSVAFRSFRNHKLFSIINVVGLAIGISASLVIFLIVQYDFSFDKFHKDPSFIYRVVSDFNFSGETFHNSGVTTPLGNAARKELTGADLIVPFTVGDEDTKISVPQTGSDVPVGFKKQSTMIFVDEAYFRLIQYKWLAGKAGSSLAEPYQVVLTEKQAGKYFSGLPPAEAVGRELLLNDTVRLTVTGIVKDIPQNTDFIFTIFVSRATLANTRLKPYEWDEWNNTNSNSQLWVKLTPAVSVKKATADLLKIFDKYHKKEADTNSSTAFTLEPLGDLHFNTSYGTYSQRMAYKPTLYGLLAVAAFLLLLGCINFINLTTAQAARRAREIGIRKTMGGSKGQLVLQFLAETFLITVMATLLSLTLAPLLLKVFADFIPEGLQLNLLKQPGIALFLLILILCVTLLSGCYPAFILSAFNPVLVLKNQAYSRTGKSRSVFFRKILTVSQFVVAQVFIIATLLVSKQISYSLNKDLGFKKDAIVYFSTSYKARPEKKDLLMAKLRLIPEISLLSLSNTPPSSYGTWSSDINFKDGKKEIKSNVQLKMVDTNYLPLYKIKLLAGTNLGYSDTARSFIINETYARLLGFTDPRKAIGINLTWNDRVLPVTGVAADFHQQSLHQLVKPLVLTSNSKQARTFNIALQPESATGNNWKAALAKIEKARKEVYPEDDLEYKFLDESIAAYYKSEQHISSLLAWATGLAIVISCLGLLGLVVYITNQRTKEIGVRKVIGATVTQLIVLLSKDFLQLVLLAFVIAIPIAWWGAHKWLENFAYKTAMSWWIFGLGGAIMLVLAFLILALRTFKAASANPSLSLRSE